MEKDKELERACGACCHFKYEDTDGWGQCVFAHCGIMHCSDLCTCDSFATEEEKRHHLAVLRKCQRCLEKNFIKLHDIDVQSVDEAIDFIVSYAKLY